MVLYKEHWYGQAGAAHLSFKEQHNLGNSCTKLPRPQPEQLEGNWDVFMAGGQDGCSGGLLHLGVAWSAV